MSKFTIASMLSSGTGLWSTKYDEPSRPSSSPEKFAKMTERLVGVASEQSRELEDRGGARRVVVGAAADRVARVGIERAVGGRAEVVEVRADHDVLAAQRRVAPGRIAKTFCVGSDGLGPLCAGGRATKCWRYRGADAFRPSDA